jgi:DNA-binding CsgD family transcriptional regulator
MDEIISDFINEIYEAATDFSYWEEIIEKLAHSTQSSSSVFLVVNHKRPELTYGEFLVNVDPEHRRIYEAGHYNKIDKFSMQLGNLSGKVIHSSNAISNNPDLFLQPEVESDFFRKFGYDHRIGFAIPHGKDQHICLYLNRGKREGDFKTPDKTIQLLNLLSPHIKRSIQLSEELTIKNDLANSLSSGFLGSTSGVIFLDQSGDIIFMNDQARKLLQDYNHIFNYSKNLTLKNKDTRLEDSITCALRTFEHSNEKSGGAFSLAGKKNGHLLGVVVSPIKLNRLVCTFFTRAKVAIFLTSSEATLTSHNTLQQLYGLTHTEASILVDFINHPDLSVVAQFRSANLQTLRSQLKSIMKKMDVNKQTELVKKVLQGPSIFLLKNI